MPSPLVTATLQAATLSSISNVLAQITRYYKQKTPFTFDIIELLRFVVLTLLTTPPNYRWQQYLERTFPAYTSKRSSKLPTTRKSTDGVEDDRPRLNIKNTFLKWFIDCMTVGALVNTAIFVALMGLLKGQSQFQIAHNVRTQTLPIILTSYKLWPIVSIINFALIPVERRIVFLSSIGLFWGIYMSLVASAI